MKNNIKILIVEDDALTAKAMKGELEKMGYRRIRIAIYYEKAIRTIKDENFDLILLDVNLKHKHTGIDIARRKEVLNKIPVIFITNYNDSETIDKLLATNPKNYLTKPLRYEELRAAILLALKKNEGIIDIGYNFTYSLDHQNLFQNKTFVKLSPKEKLLLELFITRQGECIPFQVLESSIWEYGDFSESSLRTLIGQLRKKLNSEMIVNIQGFGYKLI